MRMRTQMIQTLGLALLTVFVTGLFLCPGAFSETIENRDGKSLIATWWGSDAIAPYVYTLDFANTQYVHSAPYSLKIDYNKANDSNVYSFISAMGRWNFRNHDYLSFWVRNDGKPLKIRIRLEDNNGNPWESNWADIEPETKTSAADWENLVVDLTRTFAATSVNWSCIEQLMFVVAPADPTNRGTFWLDDVELTRSPKGIPIETFESDFYGWSGGGVFSTMSTVVEQFQNSGASTNLGQKSLKVTWGTKGANYDNFIYTPLHDPAAPNDRIGRYTNFNLYANNTVELWVKSTTDNNMPLLMKFTSGKFGTTDVSTATYTGAGNWQKLSWNFSTKVAIASKLQTMWLFPYPGAADNGGTLYIDNLTLAGGTGPAIPQAPANFTTTATVPDGDGVYTMRWSAVTGATGYTLQESTNINFKTLSRQTNLTATVLRMTNAVTTAGKTYFYRVCSYIGSPTNFGSFAAALPVTVKTIPAAARKYEIIEDFDGKSLISTWWGSDSTAPFAYSMDFGATNRKHAGKYSLQIDYNKSNDAANAYSFMSAMGLFNMREYDYLSFWVYNSGAVVRIKVRLEDIHGNPWESDWGDIFPRTKTTTADWENMVVDLTRAFYGHANGDIDMSQIAQIMFMVEAGSTTAKGTFWLDDIQLQRAANSAPLETFEADFYGWSSGAPFAIKPVSNQFYTAGTLTGLGQQALQVTWTNKTKDYSNIVYTPGHDTNLAPVGRIGNYENFKLNNNTFVEMWVKSTTESNMPILLKLDHMDVSIQVYEKKDVWQRMTWDISALPNATSVTGMYIYPYPNQADAAGNLFVDDVNLVGGTTPAIALAPTSTLVSLVNGGSYTVRWSAVSGSVRYELQEGRDIAFSTVKSYFTTGLTQVLTKNPADEAGGYYYRVRSAVKVGNVTNYGCASKPAFVELRQYETIDGFEANSQAITWWANDPTPPFVYELDFGSTQYVHSGTRALKVAYNKSRNPPNGYDFFSALGQWNLRNYDYLSFWVYNAGAPLEIRLRFEDKQGKSFESQYTGIKLQTKTTAADWENLVFDLTRTFSDTNMNWKEVSQIMFMVMPGSTTATGMFWMDDLQVWRAPNSAPLESFEADSWGWYKSALYTMTTVSNDCHNDKTTAGLGQSALRIAWTNKTADYSNLTYEPRHDSATAPLNRIGNYPNFTLHGNRTLELWVKSTTETNLPILVKLDEADAGVQTYTGTGWKKLLFDYSSITGAVNVQKVYIIPHPNKADAGGNLLIDNLSLVNGAYTPVPVAPSGLSASAVDMGVYTLSWNALAGAANYELQESLDPEFRTGVTSYFTTNNTYPIFKNPALSFGNFYYRLRSSVWEGQYNYGSFGPRIAVYVPQMDSATMGWMKNDSYDTPCAEMDNINISFVHTNTRAYRLTVTHPAYFATLGTNLNERGADFDDCNFTDRRIWIIGTNNNSGAELRQSGFGNNDEYYAMDVPAAGVDEPWAQFPKEINNDWLQEQQIIFSAYEEGDFNLEPVIGSKLTVKFAMMSGQLEIRLWIYNGTVWSDQGTRIFNSANPQQNWVTPDFFWSSAVDANRIRLSVVTAAQGGQSTWGAWGVYDYVELAKRDEAGEYEISTVFDNADVIVQTVKIDFWWRAPQAMKLVIGTNSYPDIAYFRIIKRVPSLVVTNWSQVFVLYEDGNCRLLPHSPENVDWFPFGSSVILGPTEDGHRPFVGIDTVTMDTKDLSMDITYDDIMWQGTNGGCHVELWVDMEQVVLDVTDIRYATSLLPFTRFRSMWVYDGKSDIDRIEAGCGTYPIIGDRTRLPSTWWQFYKEVPTYHNTYCPDVRVEVTEPSKAFYIRQAEVLDGGTGYAISQRSDARGGKSITYAEAGGTAIYNLNLTAAKQDVFLLLRYTDEDGGNNGTYRGNLIQVKVDGVVKDQTYSMNTGGWNNYETLPSLYLGNLSAGAHTITIVVGGLTAGIDLDEFQLVAQPVLPWTRTSLLTRQAESLNSGVNYTVQSRTAAVGGQTIAFPATGNGQATYTFSLAQAATNLHIQFRYSDLNGPNKLEVYVDGFKKARFPTETTGNLNVFKYSPEIWLDKLTAGNHTILLKAYEGNTGFEVDQFELYKFTKP